jgi:hypothetical protein
MKAISFGIIGLIIAVFLGLSATAAVEPKPSRPKWEYARLQSTLMLPKPPNKLMFIVTFRSGEKKIKKEGEQATYELYEALGGKPDTRGFDFQNVLDLLGEDGWELVFKEEDQSPGGSMSTKEYWFKRQK